jgi:hypothetical protein
MLCFSSTVYAFSFGSLFNIFKSDSNKHKPVYREVHRPGIKIQPPAHIKIGVYMLHVGKYDLQSASTRMDFYLIFKCDKACKDDINFEIMNATSDTIHLVDKKPAVQVYRVQADLSKTDNLRNYPFDNHILDVIVETQQATSDKLIFEVDPTTTAFDNDLEVVGFKLLPTWQANVTNHYYKVFQQTYSSYKFSMYIVRPWLAGFLKGILPALIIIGCSFLALYLKIEHSSQRLGVATSTLISAEVFHLNLTSSLPPLGYVTYADMFMLVNYVALLSVLIEVVMVTHFIETKHSKIARLLNKIFAILFPLVWLSLQTIVWLTFKPG